MWSSIAKVISGIAKVAGPVLSAGATIYSAYQSRKASEAVASSILQANQQARQQQRTLLASTKKAAEARRQDVAKQTAALNALLQEREEKTKKVAAVQEREKRRQRRSQIHTGPETWYGAAPLIKAMASSPQQQLKGALGG